jgi:hypothetical protein
LSLVAAIIFPLSANLITMPKLTPPRYAADVQRRAVEQVLVQHQSIAQVAKKLRCSKQTIRRWLDKYHATSSNTSSFAHTTFLPLQVGDDLALQDAPKIEVITKTGLTLRLPVSLPSEALGNIIRQLEDTPAGGVEKVGISVPVIVKPLLPIVEIPAEIAFDVLESVKRQPILFGLKNNRRRFVRPSQLLCGNRHVLNDLRPVVSIKPVKCLERVLHELAPRVSIEVSHSPDSQLTHLNAKSIRQRQHNRRIGNFFCFRSHCFGVRVLNPPTIDPSGQ